MKIAALVLALSAACSAAAEAQNSRWADLYRNGVKAFDAGKCAEAVPLLERAVAADPKAEGNKRIEGVFHIDYYPYYYLALCYVEAQQWDKAAQNLDKARTTLTRQQQPKFAEAESKIKLAANTPKVDPRRSAFEAAAAQAQSALSARQFDGALRQLDAIHAQYAAEYAAAGLAARRDEAARGYATQLADEARALAGAQKYNEAKAKLQLADQTLPNQKAVSDALADIKRREDDYQQLKTQAAADQNARNYAAAKDKYEQARNRHAELFASDNLAARINELNGLIARAGRADGARADAGTTDAGRANAGGGDTTRTVDTRAADIANLSRSAKEYLAQGKYADADATYASVLKLDPKNKEAADAITKSNRFRELRDRSAQMARANNTTGAQQALVEARALDPSRFTREKLADSLDKLTPPQPSGPDPARAALQQALTALFNGRAGESIAILEPAVQKAASAAPLHAYLGVAYATEALSAPNADDRARLQDKAVAQFKLAKSAQSDYQLSTRVVSPAIVSLYQSARP